MSTSYEPHTVIVLPNVGTHAVDQRVADYILNLAAENERLREERNAFEGSFNAALKYAAENERLKNDKPLKMALEALTATRHENERLRAACIKKYCIGYDPPTFQYSCAICGMAKLNEPLTVHAPDCALTALEGLDP